MQKNIVFNEGLCALVVNGFQQKKMNLNGKHNCVFSLLFFSQSNTISFCRKKNYSKCKKFKFFSDLDRTHVSKSEINEAI